MTARWLLPLVALSAAAGCGSSRETEGSHPVVDAPVTGPADSLVLSSPSGTEVWFTASRPAQDSAGHACVERVMEIRRGEKRIAIPLLYTGGPPRLVNDSTIEAAIWLKCRPGNVYRVSLSTGLPVRVR
jgi:hypothetical protein